jgi:hypothetical protein
MTDTLPIPISFPFPGQWIPDPHQVKTTGNILLAVAGAVLDQTSDGPDADRGQVYQRRILSTGQNIPLVPEQDGQLGVSVFEMALGRAGEQRFQFFKGTLGTYAQKFVRYQVQLARLSPPITGGIAPRMQSPDDLEDFADELWTDTWLVWSALMALALGGVKIGNTGDQLSAAPLSQDNLLIGAAAFAEPAGGLAVSKIEVQVQM